MFLFLAKVLNLNNSMKQKMCLFSLNINNLNFLDETVNILLAKSALSENF